MKKAINLTSQGSIRPKASFPLMDEPVSYILTVQFLNLVQHFGVDTVRQALKNDRFFSPSVLERHIVNLRATYEAHVVDRFFDSVYSLNKGEF